MVKPKDVKVSHRTKNCYWFKIGDKYTLGIDREDGVFKFFAYHCQTLSRAKQYIADYLNKGHKLNSI